jgi:glutathione synthase/RimK-type ligase-like ATP-grasp enzyme
MVPDPMSVALATSRELPDLWAGDRLFLDELRRRGHHADPVVWDDTRADWGSRDAVVIRSCWDYHLAPDRFRAWIDALAAQGVRTINPRDTLLWNMHKGYLLEVERAGGRIPPTRLVRRGERATLHDHARAAAWRDVVFKPAISSTGHSTRLVRGEPAIDDEGAFASAVASGDVLLQAYVPEVAANGEWSLVFFDGRYSHAALKRAAPGEFRVHIEWGGTVEHAPPPAALVAQAQRIVDALRLDAAYARVDGTDVGGELTVMELELIEPELFFDQHPEAASRLAAVIERVVRSGA